jgi:multidrug resistance efflux pump
MSQTSDKTKSNPDNQASSAQAGKGTRTGAKILLGLIVVSLLWYFVSDRITPYSSQARVQAYVVPVVSQVSGTVQNVYVKNNDLVKPGQVLFDIDSSQYQITLRRTQSDYEFGECFSRRGGLCTSQCASGKSQLQQS